MQCARNFCQYELQDYSRKLCFKFVIEEYKYLYVTTKLNSCEFDCINYWLPLSLHPQNPLFNFNQHKVYGIVKFSTLLATSSLLFLLLSSSISKPFFMSKTLKKQNIQSFTTSK